MAGLGKYKKGAKFTLKSGNSPAFKMMAGDSPIIKGASPYRHTTKETHFHGSGEDTEENVIRTEEEAHAKAHEGDGNNAGGGNGNGSGNGNESGNENEKGKGKVEGEEKVGGWKKAGQIGLAALTGGLDAVYGSGKTMPKSSDRLKKDDEEAKNLSLAELLKKHGYGKNKTKPSK